MVRLAELVLQGAGELHKAMHELRDMKDVRHIREACIRINSIENHADDIYDTPSPSCSKRKGCHRTHQGQRNSTDVGERHGQMRGRRRRHPIDRRQNDLGHAA